MGNPPTRAFDQVGDQLLPVSEDKIFDRCTRLPIWILIFLPVALQLPFWILGSSTEPIWFFSGVTQSSHLLPKVPYLDPNVGFTTEALGRLAAWDWLHGRVPWWNPYSGIGMPLAGELQPSAFFLPFNILLMLPDGVIFLRIVLQIIAGLTTYALLRELRLTRLASLMGGAIFAVNGCIAWTPGPAAVYYSLPFLPLLIWGIERARKPGQGPVSTLAVGVAIAWSLLAGFPEPAYISGVLALVWGLYRLASATNRWVMLQRTIGGLFLGLLVAAPLLISFLDYLLQSDSFAAHASAGATSLPRTAMPAVFLPYVYGPLTTSFKSKILVTVWGRIGGYVGILIVVMALVGLIGRSAPRGLRILLAMWVVISWAATFGVQPFMAFIARVPLLGHAAFYRYAPPSWIFALIVLAAFGLDEFRDGAPRWQIPLGVSCALLTTCVLIAWPGHSYWQWSRGQILIMAVFLTAAVLWSLCGLIVFTLAWRIRAVEKRRTTFAALLVVDAVVMFVIPLASGTRNNQVDTAAIRFLQDHQGLSRLYSVGSLFPNYGAYFKVTTINHNVLPVPKLWADYVDQNLFPGLLSDTKGVIFDSAAPGYTNGEAVNTFVQNIDHYREVGVRYFITSPDENPLPATMLPDPNPAPDPDGSLEPLQAHSKGSKRSRVLQWCHSVVTDEKKPSFERSIARMIAEAIGDPQSGHASNLYGNAERTRLTPLELQSEQSAELKIFGHGNTFSSLSVTAVGVRLSDNFLSSGGSLTVTLCSGKTCQSGQQPLSAVSGGRLQIPLNATFAPGDAASLRLIITYTGGSETLVFPMAHPGPYQVLLDGPQGESSDRMFQLEFEHPPPIQGLHKVYSDALMDIWEIPDPAPYYEIAHGGPCSLTDLKGQSVLVDCLSPATLRRRELYMPGWTATLNSGSASPVHQDGIFQSFQLPVGHSQLRYSFAPPHIEFGWVGCGIGVMGLLWQAIRLWRNGNLNPGDAA